MIHYFFITICFFLSSLVLRGQEIVQLEYFFDTDPGYGNGIQIPITPDSMIDIDATISLATLDDGLHTIYTRVRDTTGVWSFLQKKSFIRDSTATATNIDITEVEYFFDHDPGEGNGLPLTVVPGSDILIIDQLPLDTLPDGIHTLYVRCKNALGHWSFMQKRSFIKDAYATGSPVEISDLEFFINEDPGFGNGIPLNIPDSIKIVADTVLDLTQMPVGVHTLYTRVRNAIGNWSFITKRTFVFDDERIEFAQFKFDSIPAYADWTISNPFDPDFNITADISFEGICDLDTGWYHIDARVRRELSWWSKVYTDSIEIKEEYLQTGLVIDQFGDSIPEVEIHADGVGDYITDMMGHYSFLVPKCWGDSISLTRDSAYTAQNSYVFQNPVLDYSPHHILGDIDSTLTGYKCINFSGNIPLNQVYICENTALMVSKSNEIIDTGSISGYILHDSLNTLGTVYAMNLSGEFMNDGSLPQNQQLYVSPVVGRPGDPDLINVNHECTDILLPGKPVVFLDLIDTIGLQLDSSGMVSLLGDDVLADDCSTCNITLYALSQGLFDCTDHGFNSEMLTVGDGSGNEATCPFIVSVADTIIPVVDCRTDTTVHTDPGQCDYTVIGNLMNPDSTWDNCPTSLINDFSGTASLAGSVMPLGSHMILWTIDDSHGNTATCTLEVTVEDHEVPSIQCVTDATRSTDPGLCTYTVIASEFDPPSVTDNCTDFTFWNDSTGTATLAGFTFELGNHLITWIVDDAHGQFDTCYTTITIEDNEAPQITCSASAVRSTDPGTCAYTISGNEFDPVEVTDNCFAYTYINDSSFTNTLDGVVLGLGINLISWTVDDGHGQTASCALTVTVEDNEAPVISCATNATRNTDPDMCEYTVAGNEFDPVLVTDNCIDYIWSNDLSGTGTLDGEILPEGVTIVTWTADDQHGQTSTCEISIIIEDNQEPVIQCPEDVTLAISSAVCDTAYNYAAIATDNCPGEAVSLLSGIGSGNGFPVGVTQEVLQVEDNSGNTASCSFDVTVEKIPDMVLDTICYGDSILLEGMYQYLPGVFTDTLQNSYLCDSIVITTLDTTTYCIWPTEIVYVDSAATGENNGVDWDNAYVDMQLALDVADRYLNVRQIWVAEATYYPTSGSNRNIAFILTDSTWFLGGFLGFEADSSEREPDLYPAYLSGDIGVLNDDTDNSYHIIINPSSNDEVHLDGFVILDGNANGVVIEDQSGAGLANFGIMRLANSHIQQCSSVGLGSLIYNTGASASLILENVSIIGMTPAQVWNSDQAELHIIDVIDVH